MINTPFQYQPNFARIVIERVGQQSELRNPASVNELLHAYAQTYGVVPTQQQIDDCHELIMRRYQGGYGMRDWPVAEANDRT